MGTFVKFTNSSKNYTAFCIETRMVGRKAIVLKLAQFTQSLFNFSFFLTIGQIMSAGVILLSAAFAVAARGMSFA